MTPEEAAAFVEAQAEVVAEGGGVAALAAHLARVTGAGILIEDPQRTRLAVIGTVESPSDGTATRADRLPIRAGERHLGWLAAFDCAPQWSPALRMAAATIGVELARSASLPGSHRSFWKRLLANEYRDGDAVRDAAGASGVAVACAYVAVALESEATEAAAGHEAVVDGPDIATLIRETLRAPKEALGIVARGAAQVFLVPAPREIEASNVRTAALLLPKTAAKRLPGVRICGGVGGVAPILALARSVDEALAALSIGRRVHGPGRVCAYDELGGYPLLYEGANPERLQAFASTVLEPLRAYDAKHQTELLRTLRLYFDAGQNVKTAAAQLFVHRHTVFYRLRQIADICNVSLESSLDQLTLRMAVAIDALHT